MHIGFHTAVGIHIAVATYKNINNTPLAITCGVVAGLCSHFLFDKIKESDFGGKQKRNKWQLSFMIIYALCGLLLLIKGEFIMTGLYLLGFLSGNLPDITDTNFYKIYFKGGENKKWWFCHKRGYENWYTLSVLQDKIINSLAVISVIILTIFK